MPGGPVVLKFARGLPPSKQFGERLRLLVIQGPEKGACFSLIGDNAYIGRDGCQISLNDGNVSKRHAEIHWTEAGYAVKDLGSSNGILVNGDKVSGATLKAGDLLMIGLTVMEVYPAGQTTRNDRPLLPASARRAPAPATLSAARAGLPAGATPGGAGPGGAGAANAAPAKPALSPEEDKRKRAVEKKRLFIFAGLFLLAFILYFGTDENKTIREMARLDQTETETKAKPKKKMKKAEVAEAIAEYMPSYALDTQQRKDAEIFFRNGVREVTNKNYRRAFTAFETALTVDPSHELAKIYLKTAKIEMINELKNMNNAALQAQKSLRYREARMHYTNIVRYLEGENGGKDLLRYQENEVLKTKKKSDKKEYTIPEIYEGAVEGLKELDKVENKGQ
jgi:tetratricopeptide (TPR) repeat protein